MTCILSWEQSLTLGEPQTAPLGHAAQTAKFISTWHYFPPFRLSNAVPGLGASHFWAYMLSCAKSCLR